MNLGAFSKVFSSLPGNKPQTEIEKNRIVDSTANVALPPSLLKLTNFF